jgi:hypothetical protein
MIDIGYDAARREAPHIRELLEERNTFWWRLKSRMRPPRADEPELEGA